MCSLFVKRSDLDEVARMIWWLQCFLKWQKWCSKLWKQEQKSLPLPKHNQKITQFRSGWRLTPKVNYVQVGPFKILHLWLIFYADQLITFWAILTNKETKTMRFKDSSWNKLELFFNNNLSVLPGLIKCHRDNIKSHFACYQCTVFGCFCNRWRYVVFVIYSVQRWTSVQF